jgi:thiol-disulfide isomerase/thioredoxin
MPNMNDVKDKILSIGSSKKFFLALFLILLFIAIGMYVYKNHIKKKISKNYVDNKEFVDKESKENKENKENKHADLYFFYTDWCPHCKTDMPIWNKFKNKVGSNSVNGVKINFINVDCGKDPGTAAKYEVEAYPTIKLVYDGKVIEYDAKTEIETLNEFLNSSL